MKFCSVGVAVALALISGDAGAATYNPTVEVSGRVRDVNNVDFGPTQDGFFEVFMNVNNFATNSFIEVDLSGVGAGEEVVSATINYSNILSFNSGIDVSAYGYSGNGFAEIADGTPSLDLIGTGFFAPSSGSLALSASFINDLINNGASIFGVTLAGNAVGRSGVFDMTLSFETEQVAAPSPVPLPAGGLLLLSGLGAIVALRRRKKHSA